MKLIAIDPGNTQTGWIITDLDNGNILPGMFGKTPNGEFLDILKGELEKEEKPRVVSEFPFPRGMLASWELFKTCEFIGQIKSLCARHGVELEYVDRARVKMVVCQSPVAKDGNVRAALIAYYGEQGTKKEPGPTFGIKADVWAALGIAHTYREEGESLTRWLERRGEIKEEKAAKKARKKAKQQSILDMA